MTNGEHKTTEEKVTTVCRSMAEMLAEKNKRYGDSASKPLCVFSSEKDPAAQLFTRLDDKLRRLKESAPLLRKNDVADLLGYLVLLCALKGWTDFSEFID